MSNEITAPITLTPNVISAPISIGSQGIQGETGETGATGAADPLLKAMTLEFPTASEDMSFFFTPVAITVSEIRAVLRGSTPSVTWTLRHGIDRNATGAEIVTGGTTTTSTTSGDDVTSLDDPTIEENSFIWLETTAASGDINEIHVSLRYTKD